MMKKRMTLALFLLALPAAAQEPLRLSLAEAVERARETSPRLQRLEALDEAAAAEVRRADAGRLPTIDAGATYSRRSDVPEFSIVGPDGVPRPIFPNIPDYYAGRLGLSVPLYTGGSLRSASAAAGHEHAATGEDVSAAENDLVYEVTGAYWSLVLATERLRVIEGVIASFEAHLEDARNRQSFGLAASSDVLAVEVERDRAHLRRLEALQGRDVAESNLERLLDLPASTVIEPTEALPVTAPPEPDVEERVEAALLRRPEREALRERIAAAEAAAEIERGTKKPQVRADVHLEAAQPNPRILPPEEKLNDSWDVTLSVVYNLFDGGRRDASLARAEARAEAARQALAELDRALRHEVTARCLELRTAASAIPVAEKAVRSAEENEKVVGDRYREGLVPSSERLDAESALLAAGLDLATAQARLRLAIAGLERAVGRGDD